MSAAVDKLQAIQEKNNSLICLGLDLDVKKMPVDYTKSIKSMYEFAMEIIEATKDSVCAYKPNMAFYETLGHDGLSLLESICQRIPKDIPVILDGKRGDIGNTASFYAEAMFRQMNADWVTLNPYMGYDALRPFLEFDDKGIFVLCLTSNTGSKDFQLLEIDGKPLYKVVAEKVDYWNKENNCGLVVGATNPEQLKEIRDISGSMPLLIPGVGAQGGSLEKAVLYGTDEFKKPAVINVSRSVLYASAGNDFADRAREELLKLNASVKKVRDGERVDGDSSQPQEKASIPTNVQTTSSLAVTPAMQPSPSTPTEQPTPASSPSPAPSSEKPEQTPVEQPSEAPKPAPAAPATPPAAADNGPNTQQTDETKPNEKQSDQTSTPKPEETRKEPPPMPKPPPPLPPVPEIPRFDKPERKDNNSSSQQSDQPGSSQNDSRPQQRDNNRDRQNNNQRDHHRNNNNRNRRFDNRDNRQGNRNQGHENRQENRGDNRHGNQHDNRQDHRGDPNQNRPRNFDPNRSNDKPDRFHNN